MLDLNGFADGKASIRIIDAGGSIILQQEEVLVGGRKVIPFNIRQATGGYYLVEVLQNGKRTTVRLIKN